MDEALLAVSAVGVLGGLMGLAYAGRQLWYTARQLTYTGEQLHESRLSSRGTFLLELDAAFERHAKTHRRLRGGEWATPGAGPESVQDWADVEAYVGLFERVEVLLDSGILDAPLVNDLYGYRVVNIVENDRIRRKLIREAGGWSLFLSLKRRLEAEGRTFAPMN